MIQAISCPGRLKVGVRVLLCFTYRFVMPKFWGGEICTFGEIGDHGDQFLRFPNSLGVWGVLRLDYIGDLLFLLPVFLGVTTVIGFPGFLSFPVY